MAKETVSSNIYPETETELDSCASAYRKDLREEAIALAKRKQTTESAHVTVDEVKNADYGLRHGMYGTKQSGRRKWGDPGLYLLSAMIGVGASNLSEPWGIASFLIGVIGGLVVYIWLREDGR